MYFNFLDIHISQISIITITHGIPTVTKTQSPIPVVTHSSQHTTHVRQNARLRLNSRATASRDRTRPRHTLHWGEMGVQTYNETEKAEQLRHGQILSRFYADRSAD